MIKRFLLWMLNEMWGIQFKKVPFNGPKGYHCRDCKAGKEFFCGDFHCPVDDEPLKMMEYKFNIVPYQNILKRWRTLI